MGADDQRAEGGFALNRGSREFGLLPGALFQAHWIDTQSQMILAIGIHKILLILHPLPEIPHLLLIPVIRLACVHIHLLPWRHVSVFQVKVIRNVIVVACFGVGLMVEGHRFGLGQRFVCGDSGAGALGAC